MTDTTAKPASPGLVARGALIATAFAAVLAFVAYLATPNSPYAPKAQSTTMKIQEITSKSGLKAWLVEEHSVPLMAMRFAFDGGSAQDPTGKEGAANFLTGMLDEGAGDLDSQTFQSRMEEIAMHMSFEDGKDNFYGSFETLTENRTAAVELLKLGEH